MAYTDEELRKHYLDQLIEHEGTDRLGSPVMVAKQFAKIDTMVNFVANGYYPKSQYTVTLTPKVKKNYE